MLPLLLSCSLCGGTRVPFGPPSPSPLCPRCEALVAQQLHLESARRESARAARGPSVLSAVGGAFVLWAGVLLLAGSALFFRTVLAFREGERASLYAQRRALQSLAQEVRERRVPRAAPTPQPARVALAYTHPWRPSAPRWQGSFLGARDRYLDPAALWRRATLLAALQRVDHGLAPGAMALPSALSPEDLAWLHAHRTLAEPGLLAAQLPTYLGVVCARTEDCVWAPPIDSQPLEQNGRVWGLELRNVSPMSAFGLLGLHSGDVLLALNGVALGSSEHGVAYAPRRPESVVVLEVLREGRLLLFRVDNPVPARAAAPSWAGPRQVGCVVPSAAPLAPRRRFTAVR